MYSGATLSIIERLSSLALCVYRKESLSEAAPYGVVHGCVLSLSPPPPPLYKANTQPIYTMS